MILSRRAPRLIEALFELEVRDRGRARRDSRRRPGAGYRSKIAVESHVQGVDPVGACVGPRGSRVRMVVSNSAARRSTSSRNTEPARFVAKALAGTRPRGLHRRRRPRGHRGRARRPARARDRQGGAERPAARVWWKVDIKSDTEFAQEEAEAAFAGEDDGDGISRAAARLLSNGKRCPNAALPGSKYCGVPAHRQALVDDPTAGATVESEAAAAEAVVEDVERAEEAIAGSRRPLPRVS